ncbi:MAG: phosphoribosylamine--glycine ligase [Nitrospirae bacterium]|nr:phosphoribosylamine--glycine ligase [Nitrospirota bacterium]
MKVLVIGSGGREHALVWKIAQSPRVTKIYCAPGNAGISRVAECIPIQPVDITNLISFAKQEGISLTVVGPEAPLAIGIVDRFREAGLRIFGPSMAAAQMEASKIFSKNIMNKYNIPTAESKDFTEVKPAIDYIKEKGAPLVIKADGLAAGKGVIIASTEQEAIDALKLLMIDKAFGQAGERIIIEEFLAGEEASFLVFTDGQVIVPMPLSRDHKRIFDNDKGPNTGGMGAYSPVSSVSREIIDTVIRDIVKPVIEGLEKEGCNYEGILYTGLMITPEGKPKVLEFNCRFGDPEAQPILMRLETDIVDIIEAVIDKRLNKIEVKWSDKAAVCVVMASGGYPEKYQNGTIITGLDSIIDMEDIVVFHAGTALKDDNIVTAGGRVLGVTARGEDMTIAKKRAYEAIGRISFEGMQYRTDIGKK